MMETAIAVLNDIIYQTGWSTTSSSILLTFAKNKIKIGFTFMLA
jgi:hypothetical protein